MVGLGFRRGGGTRKLRDFRVARRSNGTLTAVEFGVYRSEKEEAVGKMASRWAEGRVKNERHHAKVFPLGMSLAWFLRRGIVSSAVGGFVTPTSRTRIGIRADPESRWTPDSNRPS